MVDLQIGETHPERNLCCQECGIILELMLLDMTLDGPVYEQLHAAWEQSDGMPEGPA
jgi:hypothetical protein